jgi:signal transduction histidine kinase
VVPLTIPSLLNTNDPFLYQLLAALVSGAGHDSACRLIAECWVRLGDISSLTIISPATPSVLQITRCSRDEQGTDEQLKKNRQAEHAGENIAPSGGSGIRLTLQQTQVEESYSSIMDVDAVLQLAPVHSRKLRRQALLWPDLMMAVVVEQISPASDEAADRDTLTKLLEQISRTLIAQASDHPIVFPRASQLEAMAEFAAGAGHEINNPLASIIGQTQLLLRNEPGIDRRQALETIGAQAWRIRDMIGNAMLFAHPPVPQMTSLDLISVVREAVEKTSENHSGGDVIVEFRSQESQLIAEADKSQIFTLISQLVRNAIEAVLISESKGTVSVVLKSSRRRHAAELTVRDSGHGVDDPIVRKHMFDPFYSGRQAGRGLGFGLSLCARIVRQHHGLLLHHPPAGPGAEFHVALPLRQEPSDSAAR